MNLNETRKSAIENYIKSYNDFDIENMIRDLDENIIFRNISGGVVNLEIEGIEKFKAQAELAKTFFSQREQKITDLEFVENEIEAKISYRAVAAVDLPNGLKRGDEIELQGKSIFRFVNGKIVEIEDIS